MRLSLHFLSWRAVRAVEQGVAKGLDGVRRRPVFFFKGMTRLHGVKCFTGFLTKAASAGTNLVVDR